MHDSPEAALCSAYAAVRDCYIRALGVAQPLALALHAGDECASRLDQLRDLLDEAARIESAVTDGKRLWQASGRKPGPQLAAVLDEVADLLRQLTACTQAAEVEATAQKGRLEPQLDAAARAREMHSAYSASMATRER